MKFHLLEMRPLVATGTSTFEKKPLDLNRCQEAEDSYTIRRSRSAYWAVLFRGCFSSDATTSKSVVGKYGHLERANAWTHLIAAAVFLTFAFIRPWALGASTLAAHLSTVAIVSIACTFAVSTVYHVYSAVPSAGYITRTLDHASIVVSLALGTVADLSLVTLDFKDSPAQTYLDPILAMVVLIAYFATRRLFIPREETREEQFAGEGCSLGLFRVFHSDLEHAGMRIAGNVTLAASWTVAIPAAFSNLRFESALVWLIGAVLATVFLASGVMLDNLSPIDNFYVRNQGDVCWPCPCTSKRAGCALNSHALWHIIAVVGAIVATVAREYGIRHME